MPMPMVYQTVVTIPSTIPIWMESRTISMQTMIMMVSMILLKVEGTNQTVMPMVMVFLIIQTLQMMLVLEMVPLQIIQIVMETVFQMYMILMVMVSRTTQTQIVTMMVSQIQLKVEMETQTQTATVMQMLMMLCLAILIWMVRMIMPHLMFLPIVMEETVIQTFQIQMQTMMVFQITQKHNLPLVMQALLQYLSMVI